MVCGKRLSFKQMSLLTRDTIQFNGTNNLKGQRQQSEFSLWVPLCWHLKQFLWGRGWYLNNDASKNSVWYQCINNSNIIMQKQVSPSLYASSDPSAINLCNACCTWSLPFTSSFINLWLQCTVPMPTEFCEQPGEQLWGLLMTLSSHASQSLRFRLTECKQKLDLFTTEGSGPLIYELQTILYSLLSQLIPPFRRFQWIQTNQQTNNILFSVQ